MEVCKCLAVHIVLLCVVSGALQDLLDGVLGILGALVVLSICDHHEMWMAGLRMGAALRSLHQSIHSEQHRVPQLSTATTLEPLPVGGQMGRNASRKLNRAFLGQWQDSLSGTAELDNSH